MHVYVHMCMCMGCIHRGGDMIRMYTCTYMYTYMYMCAYIHTCMFMWGGRCGSWWSRHTMHLYIMYVCMYVCIHTHTHVHVYTCMYVTCTNVCKHVVVHLYLIGCTCVLGLTSDGHLNWCTLQVIQTLWMYTYMCTYMYMCVHMCVMCVHVYAYTYMYMCACIHVYVHTCTSMCMHLIGWIILGLVTGGDLNLCVLLVTYMPHTCTHKMHT